MTEQNLDCKGLNCPLPIVRISQTIKKMGAGDTLSVEATDPAFRADLEAWTRRMGHELVSFEEGSCLRATLRKVVR
jgi:tRNA 2-thiouridine synthesizing protein A